MTIVENIDQELWRNIQDKFSQMIGLPVITLDVNGKPISQSGEYPFFCQLMMKNKEGGKRCANCQNNFLKEMMMSDKKIEFFKCHAELTYILVPIIVKNKKIGAVVVPAIRRRENSAHLSRIGVQTEIDAIELIDSYKKIRLRSKEDIIRFGSLMYALSQTIPVALHEKHMATKKINRLLTLQHISHKLVSSLNVKEVITHLLKTIKTEIYLDSSVILFFDKKKSKFSLDNSEISPVENELAIRVLMTNKDSYNKDKRIISIPLIVSNDIVGVVNIFCKDYNQIESNIDIFHIISDMAASSIVNCRQFEAISSLAITDRLTGLYNRTYFSQAFEDEIKMAKRTNSPLSIAIFDLDYFGSYNNEFGHLEGDHLLEIFAKILKDSFRETDIVARYGGEEFIVILPNTYSSEAYRLAENVRISLGGKKFHRMVTTSASIVCSLDHNADQRKIIKAADDALYKSKAEGRNRINISEIMASSDIQNIEDLNKHVY